MPETLLEYLAGESRPPAKGTPGIQSGWLHLCALRLAGGPLLVIDPSFAPFERHGLLIDLPVGEYEVLARVMDYGTEKRVSRLRVLRVSSEPQVGGEIGKTWSDTARIGACDYEAYKRAWGDDDDRAWQIVGPTLEQDPTGVAVLDQDSGAVLPFVESGFGDGEFPVFELRDPAAGVRVGIEVEFIPEGTAYPF